MMFEGPITEHFTWKEALHSTTARKNNIANIPDPEQAMRIRYTATKMESVRELLDRPIIIYPDHSWFRCLPLNRLVGSRDYSQHCRGEAVDHEVEGMSLAEAFHAIRESKIPYDQLILEKSWIHVSFTLRHMPRRNAFILK